MNPLQNFISRLTGSKTLQQAQAVAADPELAAQSVKLAAVFESAGLSLADALADENLIAKAIANAREQGEAAASAQISELSAKLTAAVSSEALACKSLAAFSAIGAKLGVMPDAPAEEIAKAFEKHASLKAADILGSQGIAAPVADGNEVTTESDAQIVAKFNAMTPGSPERIAYLAAHREVIWASRR